MKHTEQRYLPFEQDYLCATCSHTDRSCPDRDKKAEEAIIKFVQDGLDKEGL